MIGCDIDYPINTFVLFLIKAFIKISVYFSLALVNLIIFKNKSKLFCGIYSQLI